MVRKGTGRARERSWRNPGEFWGESAARSWMLRDVCVIVRVEVVEKKKKENRSIRDRDRDSFWAISMKMSRFPSLLRGKRPDVEHYHARNFITIQS